MTASSTKRGEKLESGLPADALPTRCGSYGPTASSAVARPFRLGKYLLLRKIAAGGMGEVHFAKSEGVEGFERMLAIKRMLPHLSADRSFVEMLVNEAKITVLLNHPNIVQVFDLAREGDEYYIVMEYVPGIAVHHLVNYCAEHSLVVPVPVAVHIVALTLKGLAYAHSLRGPDGAPMRILHRDVTPQNLLLTRQGWVKITDFGIAKACNEISSTLPGTVKGKLGYIAPEIMSGGVPDRRADIFSAGVVLWELLAMRRLFKGHNDLDFARQVRHCVVPRLSALREDVGPELEACVAAALAKEPEERFADADSFYDALIGAAHPLTVDDCARQTTSFLAVNEAMFAGKLADEDPACRAPASPLQSRAEVAASHRRAGRSRRGLIAAVGGAVVLFAAGAGVASYSLLPRGVPGAPAAALAEVAPSAEEPPPPALAPTPPPAERSPGRAPKAANKPLGAGEIQAAVQRSFGAMAKCLRQLNPATGPAAIAARLTVTAGGRVESVRLEPAIASAPGGCLASALKGIHFRPGPSAFEITIPLTIEPSRP